MDDKLGHCGWNPSVAVSRMGYGVDVYRRLRCHGDEIDVAAAAAGMTGSTVDITVSGRVVISGGEA